MSSLPYIHLIADYGTGDLSFAEVIQRFKFLLPDVELYPLSTPPFSTLNTGFFIAQLAVYNPSHNLFIYSNTAPRKDDHKKREANAGELFKYARLKNNAQICAVDAGWCFSFVKDEIVKFRLIKTQNHGSQFRSRDFYPYAAAGIIKGKTNQYLGKPVTVDSIPAIPENRISHIDPYGNIKTTTRRSQIKLTAGAKIRMVINHIYQTGIYANGNFEVKSGDMAFAPGSSGGDDPFMEIFLRSGNASRQFLNPPVETKFRIEKI
ncbi:MAG: SAM-dependent chlorinase/fluorinase [Candidatus Beckwithbacteria bacterium]|nr:SAM-dependent chlorinase/fluorinase [Candidatus Beckwithbacteria bacterium]